MGNDLVKRTFEDVLKEQEVVYQTCGLGEYNESQRLDNGWVLIHIPENKVYFGSAYDRKKTDPKDDARIPIVGN